MPSDGAIPFGSIAAACARSTRLTPRFRTMRGTPSAKPPMTYRSLLVLLDADPLCTPRVQLATRLARQLDCHLVGVAPTGFVDLPVSIGAAASLAEFAALA